jgi:hypothetical protein
MPISLGFLAFPPGSATPSHIGKVSDILSLFCNGSAALAVTGRDKDATWRTFGTLCRERDWSRQRLLYELQNGLPCRTVPPGHTVDWHHPDVVLDVQTSEVTYTRGGVQTEGVTGFDRPTVGIEVLPPTDAEAPAPPAAQVPPHASAQWAAATVRDQLREGKLPDEARKTKAALARFLEGEAQTAAKAGRLSRALKASYLEDRLVDWGIWPLSSRK